VGLAGSLETVERLGGLLGNWHPVRAEGSAGNEEEQSMGAGGKESSMSRQKLGYRAVSDPDFPSKLLSSPLSTCIIQSSTASFLYLKSPETKTTNRQNGQGW
jgi:hypothetical protein